MSEYEAKKACVSEMFMDTSKFSTKTLSAINGLEGAVLRKKDKEYNWRKEMDDYEKRAEFERDVRARNVSALHRDGTRNVSTSQREDKNEDHWVAQRKTEDRKRQSYETAEKPTEKVAKKDSEAVKSWREKREAERVAEKAEPEPEKKSWREKLAEKQKQEEEEKKQREADAEAAAAMSKAAREKALAVSAEASSADETAKPANAQAEGGNAEEEEEDHNGTKQLKSDVGFLFSGLEQEFEAGKSKLAKLRERIKKVKTAIKEADDGDNTEENKESEAEKDKRRAELREKFRLQREAKKKAQQEQQK
jgi:colicin import membrane protein